MDQAYMSVRKERMNPLRHIDESRPENPFRRRIVPFLAIFLAVAISGDSVESAPPFSTGAGITKTVPFVRESIDEIRASAPFRERTIPGDRAIPFHRIPRRFATAGQGTLPPAEPALAAPFLASSPSPSAPVLDSSFAGLGNPPATQGDVIPPDTMGAVGPNHIVSLLNSDFGVFDKTTGVVLQKISLQSFWASLGTAAGEPANFPFDTKVLYDTSSARFFAVTLGGTNAPNSWILAAVSASSDPTGPWNKWAIDADLDNNAPQFNNWADFPGVGLDGNNLYVSANMFSNGNTFQYGKIWVLPKPQLLSGSASLSWTEFRDPAGSSFSMQPAHTFGLAAAEYFIYEGNSGQLLLARIDNSAGTPTWHAPTAVAVAPYVSVSALPGAPQSGNDNTIDTSDTRLLNVVYRADSLWTVHTVQSPATVKTEVAWYQIDPGTATVLSQGRISDPTRWYYYPSIGVNANGDVAVGMSGSSATEFVGGYYTARRFTDPGGTMQQVSLLKAGEQPYFKTLGGADNRWGDYSATVVDPNGNLRFWTVQEYAATPSNRWGTWWGSFILPPLSTPSAPFGLVATPVSGSAISLAWVDNSSNEDSFVIERRTGAGPFLVIATPSTNDSAAYSDGLLDERTTYTYRVKARNSLGDSGYTNESTATPLLATPGNATAVAVSSTLVNISWTDLSNFETGYRVERKTGTGGSFAVIADLPAGSNGLSDNTVSAGTFYSYRIQAVDIVTPTNSAYSNEASVTTPGSPAAGGGGGGCLSITQSEGRLSFGTSLFSVGLLLLPACALGLRRFFLRRERAVPIRHPLC
ncbi:MAG: fibronectin type III domain-containing protein [Deltaproteobacteria bacterium]|nr:fibronectin type III domain-containing protein [Deltaproteobacteria bacterium]